MGRTSLSKRLLMAALFAAFSTDGAFAVGATVELRAKATTGEVSLRNPNAAPFDFVLYSIKSAAGTLSGANGVWRSIADTYDLSGTGEVDADFNWTELLASSTDLTEGAFLGPGGTLTAGQQVSLGTIWDPRAAPADLEAEVVQADEQLANVLIRYIVPGDYDGDLDVDVQDYDEWRDSYGSRSQLSADGNENGIVDAADYVVWRDNLGASLTLAGSGAGSMSGLQLATGVPEPASVGLLASATCWLLFAAGRRTRSD